MFRFIRIWFLIFKYGLSFLLIKLGFSKRDKFKLIKNFFEDAGGSFIKFGQLLAIRTTVFPEEFSLQMLDLLDNYNPFPYADVKEVFLEDLGAPPEKIFKDFQKDPFASASFGQVHAAKLEDDSIVVVKVRRPGIEEQVHIDFFIVNLISFLGDIFFRIKALSWREFAGEFKKWTLEELDYHREAANTERLYNLLKDNDTFVVPQIYPKYSTKRILVEEYLEGMHLSRVLRGLKDGRLNYESMLKMGVDLKKLPHILLYEFFRQYFYYGFFHADLHPGNIILLPNKRIGLIDFGIIGTSIPFDQHEFVEALKGIGNFEFKDTTYHMSNIMGEDMKQLIQSAFPASVSQQQIDEFMRILTDHFSEIVEKTVRGSVSKMREKKLDYLELFIQIIKLAENYKVHMPKEMTIFVKTFSTIGILCKELSPDHLVQTTVKKFFQENKEEDFFLAQGRAQYRRMNRERAIDQLHNWLAYLLEVDPAVYHLVNNYIKQYNLLGNG